jgi:hypothetical protein
VQRTHATPSIAPGKASQPRNSVERNPGSVPVPSAPAAESAGWDMSGTPVSRRNECPTVRRAPLPHLTVGGNDEAAEHEAGRLAERAMTAPGGGIVAPAARRTIQEPHRNEEDAASAPLAHVHDVLRAPGHPLDAYTRAYMEPRFGQDFSQIRVHADPAAGASARALNANAYAAGRHLVFADGLYAPHTSRGRRLLAHELAHVQLERNDAEALTLRRDPPQPGPGGKSGASKYDPGADREPGWAYWLASDDFDSMPGVEEARDTIGKLHPELIRALIEGSVEQVTVADDKDVHLVFHHPSGEVIGRAKLSKSGQAYLPKPKVHYGVYVYMRDSDGQALYGFGRAPSANQAPPQPGKGPQGPAGPPDPLLDLYFKQFPSTPGGRPTSVVDASMRLRLALSLADRSLFGSIYDAAIAAISDPMFIVITVLTIGIYVGLWLTPDPTLITKVAAGIFTAVMLTMFGWNDLIGFGRAWLTLEDASASAKTEDELRAAGNAFMKKLGQVGFDVFVMVLFWGAGKAFKGQLQSARASAAENATARAEASLTEAEAQPGSGGKRAPVSQPELGALKDARTAAGEKAAPKDILDKLADKLPEDARKGLEAKRASGKPGTDKQILDVLDARARNGQDVFRWLTESGLSKGEINTAQQARLAAAAKLARARLVQLKVLDGFKSGSRSAMNDAQNIVADLARALAQLSPKFRSLVKAGNLDAVIGDLGETLARGQLEQTLQPGQQVISSLELAEPVPGVKTIAEWAAKQRAAGLDPNKTGLGAMRESPDGVFRSVGQIDNAVVRPAQDGTLQFEGMEETKTGSETGASAKEQVGNARTTVQNIFNGSGKARIFEKLSGKNIGPDVTGRFSMGGNVKATTRGPAGREGFDADLGVSREVLKAVAQTVIAQGVPAEPGAARQVLPGARTPGDDQKKAQPPGKGATPQ